MRQLPYLIAYDIADPRRLSRVQRLVARHAEALQLSVYLLHATEAQIDDLCEQIRALIDEQADDVRIYPIRGLPCHHGASHDVVCLSWQAASTGPSPERRSSAPAAASGGAPERKEST